MKYYLLRRARWLCLPRAHAHLMLYRDARLAAALLFDLEAMTAAPALFFCTSPACSIVLLPGRLGA